MCSNLRTFVTSPPAFRAAAGPIPIQNAYNRHFGSRASSASVCQRERDRERDRHRERERERGREQRGRRASYEARTTKVVRGGTLPHKSSNAEQRRVSGPGRSVSALWFRRKCLHSGSGGSLSHLGVHGRNLTMQPEKGAKKWEMSPVISPKVK